MKVLRKLTVFLLLAALLLPALALPAAALGDARYTEEDPAADPAPAVDQNIVWLTDSMSFDKEKGEFVYPVGNSGSVVRASVANGMIVNGPVRITGATLLIYLNGKLWEEDPSNITEPGEYVVLAQTGNQTPRLFTFTLVGSSASLIYSYNLPAGMIVIDATRDGEEIVCEQTAVPMQEDGAYHIVYECLAAGRTYELNLNVDRTPPELRFDGKIDENHRVHSALTISGLQQDDTLQATLDGTPIELSVQAYGTVELAQSGSYIFTVYDAAGNRSEYGYTIMLYLNAGSLAFFALLIAAIVTVVVYIIIKRKRLEIG